MRGRKSTSTCTVVTIVVIIQTIVILVLLMNNGSATDNTENEINNINNNQHAADKCPRCPTCPHCPTCPDCPVCTAKNANSDCKSNGIVLPHRFESEAQDHWPIYEVREPTPFWMCLRKEEIVSEQIIGAKMYAPREAMIFYHLLKDPETGCKSVPGGRWVVDVGSQMGFFSLLSATMGCRVISVEPQRHWYPNFLISVRVNGFDDRIKLYKGAATSQANSKATIGYDYIIGGVHGLGSATEGKSMEVDTFRLDEILEENSIDNILLLKIDVEGFEMEVLNGMTNFGGTIENYLMEVKLGFNIGVSDEVKKQWIAETTKKNNLVAYQFIEEYGYAPRVVNWDVYQNKFFKYDYVNSHSEDLWITADKRMAELYP